MNKHIEQLYKIAQKEERLIIGLMSGTSLDGLDIALCSFKGFGKNTNCNVLAFETIPYQSFFRTEIQSVFSKQNISLEKLCLLNAHIAKVYASMINHFLEKHHYNREQIDLIASHGQTIYHAPKHLHQQQQYDNATLQIGEGDHLAVNTGITTISDFRQKHVAAGGEGAPLALYGDFLLFTNDRENRIMLNIGGISNFTYLPSSGDANKIICTDCGPGNTLMDAYVLQNFPPNTYDKNAALAMQGTPIENLLHQLMQHSFFQQVFPKTTGPELFNLAYLQQAIQTAKLSNLNHYNVLATLNLFTAKAIAQAINTTIGNTQATIYTSGGGKHNPLLIQNLQQLLPRHSFKNIDELQINADAKEAVLFALLANETVAGNGFHFTNLPNVNFGKISFPS